MTLINYEQMKNISFSNLYSPIVIFKKKIF